MKLLVNPLARGAWFDGLMDVAQAELAARFPRSTATPERLTTMELLATDLPLESAAAASRLSFVQGIFAPIPGGLTIVEADPGFLLPRELVWGAKYRGKTHEIVTQLALNLALAASAIPEGEPPSLLDPVAGRGTTLLWAARYGVEAVGIERDPEAPGHLQRHVKRQTKLRKLKHHQLQGTIGRRRKDGAGRFLEYRFGARGIRLVTGDSRDAAALLNNQRFHLVVGDLPYGVQFGGRGRRNPIDEIAACAPAWADRLRPGGAMVLIYNRLQPSREAMVEIFTGAGLEVLPWDASHRVSESIWRDLLVLRRGA